MSSCLANTGKKQGCQSGAIGAVVGELAAQWYDPNGTKPPQDTLNFVKVVSAAAGAITGDGSAESVSTASMTGVNAAENNYLNHTKPGMLALSEKEQYERAVSECAISNPSACQKASELRSLSRARDQQLQQACAAGPTQQCATLGKQARDMGNNVYNDGNFVWANSPDKNFGLNVSTVGAKPSNPALTNSWHHRVSQSTSEALVVGVPGAAGRVLSTSGGAFVAGAGFDAAGQYVQNGAVRPEQSLVAGATAAVGANVLLRTPRQWTIYAAPTVGAGAAATNTTFNNAYYDESTNVWLAAGLGAGFSAAGQAIGPRVQNVAAPYITSTPRIPITGAAYIPSTPARLPSVPSYVGSTVNNTVSNVPSFIPLDNGKSQRGVKP